MGKFSISFFPIFRAFPPDSLFFEYYLHEYGEHCSHPYAVCASPCSGGQDIPLSRFSGSSLISV